MEAIEGQKEEARTVAYSEVMGLLPCQIVGCNETNYLVRVCGMKKPLSVPRSLVFELEEGWDLQGGQLVRPGSVASLTTCPATQEKAGDDA